MKPPEGMTIVPAPELDDAELAQVAHFRIHLDDFWSDLLDHMATLTASLQPVIAALNAMGLTGRDFAYMSRKSYRYLKKKRRLAAHYQRKINRIEQYPTKGWTRK